MERKLSILLLILVKFIILTAMHSLLYFNIFERFLEWFKHCHKIGLYPFMFEVLHTESTYTSLKSRNF